MADAEVYLTKIPEDVKEQLHELELELSEGKFWALYIVRIRCQKYYENKIDTMNKFLISCFINKYKGYL